MIVFKRITFEEYILASVFAAVAFITLVFASYINDVYHKEKLSQGYYGSDTIYLQVFDLESKLDYEALYAGFKDAILFQELSGEYVRGVLFHGDIDSPPLLEGRFFMEDDFFNGKKLAVAGNTYDPAIKHLDGRDYLVINQENYEVIGRLGTGEISQLDKMLLINLDAVAPETGGLYAIDGISPKRIAAASTFLQCEVDKCGGSSKLIEREPTGIKRLLKYEQSNALLFAVLVLVFLLSSAVVNLSLFEKKKSEIAAGRLLGFSSARIIGQVLKSYLLLSHIGYIGGLLPGLLLVYLDVIHLSSPVMAAVSYLIILLFGLILVTLPVALSLRCPARELLSE